MLKIETVSEICELMADQLAFQDSQQFHKTGRVGVDEEVADMLIEIVHRIKELREANNEG